MTKTFLVPVGRGGCSIYKNLDVQTTGSVIKASPGQVYGYHFHNRNAAIRHLKFYNKATAATSGDTPVLTVSLPANWENDVWMPQGWDFSTGIGIRASTLVADNDNTAPTANDVVVGVWYI